MVRQSNVCVLILSEFIEYCKINHIMSAQEDEFESYLLFLTDEEDITNDSPPEADWLGMIC